MTTLETKVDDFLGQKRIAVAGVSHDHSSHPASKLIYNRLKKTGHDVFAVSPNMQTFEGDPCYPNLQAIPGGVDGVVIITRPEITERMSTTAAKRECRAFGCTSQWQRVPAFRGKPLNTVAKITSPSSRGRAR